MREESDIPSHRRAEHWLLMFIDERLMRHKPAKFEPDQYSTEVDIARVKGYDEGWWDAIEQLSIIGEEIKRGDYG